MTILLRRAESDTTSSASKVSIFITDIFAVSDGYKILLSAWGLGLTTGLQFLYPLRAGVTMNSWSRWVSELLKVLEDWNTTSTGESRPILYSSSLLHELL